MAESVFCYNCNSTEELKDIKKSEISIRGKCKKCGMIISKNISRNNLPVPPISTTSQKPIIKKES